jgi:hypothetical protein
VEQLEQAVLRGQEHLELLVCLVLLGLLVRVELQALPVHLDFQVQTLG